MGGGVWLSLGKASGSWLLRSGKVDRGLPMQEKECVFISVEAFWNHT